MNRLWQWIRRHWVNRETAAYVGFGTLTTVVDFAVFNISFLLLEGKMNTDVVNLMANAIAWVAAVVFSYFVNKRLVFRRHAPSRRLLLREMWQFLAARLLSLLLSEVGMFLLFTVARLDRNVSKIITALMVMASNYIFMKYLVFKPRKEEPHA